jgi:hypothetical protein
MFVKRLFLGRGNLRKAVLLALLATPMIAAGCSASIDVQSKSYKDGFSYVEAQPQNVRDNVECVSAIINAPPGGNATQWAQGCDGAEGVSPMDTPIG